MRKLCTAICSFIFVIMFSITSFAGSWKNDANGWWWDNGDGTYPKNCWQWCDGNGDGVAESYYFDQNGYCLRNTTTPDGYTVNNDGAWVVNGVIQTKAVNANTETKQSGWVKDGYGWKYYENGKYLTEKIITDPDGCSYIVGDDGYMVYGGWYGLYYVDDDGHVLKNTITPDGYYVDSTGKWVTGYSNYSQLTQNQNRCIHCNGTGVATCGICLGNPVQMCMICNGTGCSTVFGSRCFFCNGTGYSKCMYCNGRGYNTCTLCSGRGYLY